jgi:glycosyltransferase involved in cell wall biosynthesis
MCGRMTALSPDTSPLKICLFLYGLTQGGVPRRSLSLAQALADAGHAVEIVTVAGGNRTGALGDHIGHVALAPLLARVPWVSRTRKRQFALARPLFTRHLVRSRPDVIIAADTYANLCAVAARESGDETAPERMRSVLILTQRKHASTYAATKPALIARMRKEYARADAIVGVSQGVADDLIGLGLPASKVSAIYNPVVAGTRPEHDIPPPEHRWFADVARPVIVAAGRLAPQKDFPTLLRAFARLHARGLPHRLMILGGGDAASRAGLRDLAEQLGIAQSFCLQGHVAPIEPWLAHAALFVLSSRFEGLPGVLIEALACGTPVVSCDCPSGPREILLDGRIGALVPVGDDAALASVMEATLANPGNPQSRIDRAADFSIATARGRYLDLIAQLLRDCRGRKHAASVGDGARLRA